MKRYTVKQLAKLSGVSVRTLHHYDEVGLLRPAEVGANGYRYYGREELLRLQQILFHRELEFPLEQIRRVLDDPGFDRVGALREQRQALAAKASRYRRLLKTLDETLGSLAGETDMKDQDLYKGFAPEKQAEYEAWLVDRYGDGMAERIDASKAKMKSWSKQDFEALNADAEAFEAELAQAMGEGLPADSQAVMQLMQRHHAWIGRTWDQPPTRESYCGLADLYQAHPDFRARYDNRSAGLCDYLASAMRAYAEARL